MQHGEPPIRLTEQLGACVRGLDASSTPEEARRRAIGGFIDCVGVMTAGAKETVTTVVRKTAASRAAVLPRISAAGGAKPTMAS